jgi:glycine/D-amino acid oxidase-like deaminating enzyme
MRWEIRGSGGFRGRSRVFNRRNFVLRFAAPWEKLDELLGRGELLAREEVLFELERKDDDVYRWARERRGMFVQTDEDIQRVVQAILVDYPDLVDAKRGRSGEDPFVIALARARGCTMLANERLSTSLTRPRIPNVCQALGILCIDLLQFIREHGWVFR